MNLMLVLPGIAVMAVLLVMLPVGATVFRHFQNRKQVTCPATARAAAVSVAPARAALGEALGLATMRIQGCSLWGDDRHCAESCRPLLMDAPDAPDEHDMLGPSVRPYTGVRGTGDGGSWHPFVYC